MEQLEIKVTAEALPDHVGEDVRNVLPEMGAEEQVNSLDVQEAAIAIEIAEEIEGGGGGEER